MQQGEVWMVSLPFSGGREQSGERPAVVLQDAVYGQSSPLVLIALLSSQMVFTGNSMKNFISLDPVAFSSENEF